MRRLVFDEVRVVEILQALLLHEIAKNLHVAMALLVGGEDVVVGDDDDAVRVPDLGVGAELVRGRCRWCPARRCRGS